MAELIPALQFAGQAVRLCYELYARHRDDVHHHEALLREIEALKPLLDMRMQERLSLRDSIRLAARRNDDPRMLHAGGGGGGTDESEHRPPSRQNCLQQLFSGRGGDLIGLD